MISYDNRNKEWLKQQEAKNLEEYYEKNKTLNEKEREALCKLQLIKNKRIVNKDKRIGVIT